MPAFANPVAGVITPHGVAPAPGQFTVTATFGQIDSFHPGPLGHQGVDLGDGKCGSPILAMCDGTVTAAYRDPNGALIVRYRSTRHPEYEFGLAHMPSLETAVGRLVTQGQVIGHIGTTGATACHLHWGTKLNGVEIDGWPLLTQNGATEDDVKLKGKLLKQLYNRTAKTIGSPAANFRDGVTTADPILHAYPPGTITYPDVEVEGQLVNGSASWYGCWLYVDALKSVAFGYFHSSTLSALSPVESTGFSQADLDKAAQVAKKAGATAVAQAAAVAATKV